MVGLRHPGRKQTKEVAGRGLSDNLGFTHGRTGEMDRKTNDRGEAEALTMSLQVDIMSREAVTRTGELHCLGMHITARKGLMQSFATQACTTILIS